MPNISKITLPSGTTYFFKDATAREMAAAGVSFSIATEASDTPAGVTWNNGGTLVTGTLIASASTSGVFYLVPATTASAKDTYAEYVTVQSGSTYSWEKIGTTDIDLSNLGDLAYKNSASTSYTPAGTISKPSITVTPSTVSVKEVDNTGSVTAGTANVPTAVTLPVFTTSVENETLVLGWSAGSVTAGTAGVPTAVTLPTTKQTTVMTSASAALAANPEFTGTQATITVS